MIVFLNGKFFDSKQAKVSAFDHGFLYADGVYETLRTYGGRVWQSGEHLKRLRNSAGMIGLSLPWSLKQIEAWINGTVVKNGFKESRIRVTVTRGENGFDFGPAKKPTICIQVQKLIEQPASVYKRGVKVVSFEGERLLPEAKTLNLLPMVLAQQFMLKKKAYEALFVDAKGRGGERALVREGTVTNVFMVKNGVLMTPGKNILAGTTRDAVLKVARRLGLQMKVGDIQLRDLYEADEVFLTNAPRGIVPVCQVDGKKIGERSGTNGGCPGKITKKLIKAFDDYVRAAFGV